MASLYPWLVEDVSTLSVSGVGRVKWGYLF